MDILFQITIILKTHETSPIDAGLKTGLELGSTAKLPAYTRVFPQQEGYQEQNVDRNKEEKRTEPLLNCVGVISKD